MDHEELDAYISESDSDASNSSTPYLLTPRTVDLGSPSETALSPGIQKSTPGQSNLTQFPFSDEAFIEFGNREVGPPMTIVNFIPATASDDAAAIATAMATPEAAAPLTDIRVELSPTGLENFLMHDLYEIMGIQRYYCPECGESYSRPQDRRRHLNSKHTKRVTFACTFPGCDRRYTRPDVQLKHSRSH